MYQTLPFLKGSSTLSMLIFIFSFFFITLFNSAFQCYLLYFICILFVFCINSSVDFELSPFLFAVAHCFLSYLCCFLNCICQFAIHNFLFYFCYSTKPGIRSRFSPWNSLMLTLILLRHVILRIFLFLSILKSNLTLQATVLSQLPTLTFFVVITYVRTSTLLAIMKSV